MDVGFLDASGASAVDPARDRRDLDRKRLEFQTAEKLEIALRDDGVMGDSALDTDEGLEISVSVVV